MSANLVDEPWIPVRTRAGVQTLSLRDLLLRSHHIVRLAFPAPTLVVAVLRQVVLPVVLDALGPPTDEGHWGAMFRAGQFDRGAIEGYLDEHRARFDLFDETAPFAQAAGLRTPKDEVKSVTLLVPTEANGNNTPLFSSRTEGDGVTLSWQEAAAWVLHCHCFDTAAIKSGAVGDPQVRSGKTTGNPVGSVGRFGVVVPQGRNLFDTLMLNLPISPDGRGAWIPGSHDLPQWRRSPEGPQWETREAAGILDLLTWQSRRVRLVPSNDGEAAGPVVRSVVVAAGDRLFSMPEQEPHTLWTKESGGNMESWRPRRHRSGRASWRGLDGLLARDEATARTSRLLSQIGELWATENLDETYPLGVEVVGVEYGNQSAVVENVVHDAIPLPIAALRADCLVGELVSELGTDARALESSIDELEANLRLARGGEPVPWNKGARASTRLVHRLDGVARRVLSDLQRKPDRVEDARLSWQEAARFATKATAQELLAELPPAAFAGRVVDGRAHRASDAEAQFRARLGRALGDTNKEPTG